MAVAKPFINTCFKLYFTNLPIVTFPCIKVKICNMETLLYHIRLWRCLQTEISPLLYTAQIYSNWHVANSSKTIKYRTMFSHKVRNCVFHQTHFLTNLKNKSTLTLTSKWRNNVTHRTLALTLPTITYNTTETYPTVIQERKHNQFTNFQTTVHNALILNSVVCLKQT